MTFDTVERSRTLGQPAELYLFRYGEDDALRYAYTDADEAITIEQPTVDGLGTEMITYLPVPIQRGSISSAGTLDKAPLEVRMAASLGLVDVLRGFRVSYVVLLTIRQGHRSDPANEWLVSWTGRVMSSSDEEAEAVLNCEPSSTSMRRVGLRRHWQYGCPHWLYGPHCRADRVAATVQATVVAVAGSVLTVADGFNAEPLPKYIGGLASWSAPEGDILQTIIRVVDNPDGTVAVTLGSPVEGLAAADLVNLALGCNHTMTDCQQLHVPRDEPVTAGGNIHNYGGQPFIPGKNPIGIVNQYY